jgi:uncharacterized protein
MPRPKKIRRVSNPPHFKGFRPIGVSENTHPVVMNYEEYEAIRLNDFELFSQLEASQEMGVSRPTYTRIYESARRKVAQAFVNGQPIVFEGGKVYFDSDWYKCNDCGCYFNHHEKEKEVNKCALCSSVNIGQATDNQEYEIEDVCICPLCGMQKVKTHETPEHNEMCPKCSCRMILKKDLIPNKETIINNIQK